MSDTKFNVVLAAKLNSNSLKTIQEQLNNMSAKIKLDIPVESKNLNLEVTAKLSSDSLATIQSQLNKIASQVNFNIPLDKKVSQQLKDIGVGIDGVGQKSKRAVQHLQTFDDKVSKFLEWEIIGDVINLVEDAIGGVISQVFELDEVLTELAKVTDLSSEGLKEFANDAFDVASAISSTGQAVLEASVIFAQAGYSASEALDLAQWATVLTNVSEAGATAEKSANTLIATMKAFGLETSDVGHVVDVLNEVSNNYAVSVTNLSTAIQKSSASLATGNNTLEESIALNTAGIEILRESGRVANGLSTITARLTADNDEYIKSITKGEGIIDSRTGDLRSTFDILKDLSEAWGRLSGIEKQELTEVVAGKTQRSLFTALMENFDTAVGAAADALNSEGSAMTENSKRAESLQGKLNALNNAAQEFSNTLDSDLIKGLISTATALTQFGTAIGGVSTFLPALIALLTTMAGAKLLAPIILSFKNFIFYLTSYNKITNVILREQALEKIAESAKTAATSIAAVTSKIAFVISIIAILKSLWDSYWKNRREQMKQEIDSIGESVSSLEDIKKQYQEVINSQKSEAEKQQELYELQTKLNEAVKNNNLNLYSEDIENATKKLNELSDTQKKVLQTKLDVLFKQATQSESTNQSMKNFLGVLFGFVFEVKDAVSDVSSGISGWQGYLSALGKELPKGIISQLTTVNEAIEKYNNMLIYASENGNTKLAETSQNAIRALSQLRENIKAGSPDLQNFVDSVKDQIDIYEGDLPELFRQTLEAFGVDLTEYDYKWSKVGQAETEAAEKLKEYNKTIDEAEEAISRYQSKFDKQLETLETYQSNLDLLKQAQEEYNDTQKLSIDTYAKLKDADLLKYIQQTGNAIIFNSQAFMADANAAKENTLAILDDIKAQKELELTAAAANDKLYDMAAALGLVTSASDDVQIALKKMNAIFAGQDYSELDFYKEKLDQQISAQKELITNLTYDTYSKSSTKKTSAEYKATIDVMYEYSNALDIAKAAVDKLNKSISSTNKLDEQENYIRQIIPALQEQINKTNDLRNAQSGQIQSYIYQLRKQGFAIDYVSESNELYIRNMEHLLDFTGDTAKDIEKLIKQIQSWNTNNITLDNSIIDLTKNISDFYTQLEEFPETKLKKFQEIMEDFQKNILNQTQYIIDDLEQQLKTDPRIKALDAQIEALEKQNETINKQKNLEEKLLAVEEAREKLANAASQRTVHLLTEEGWSWVQDIDAVENAAKELADAQESLQAQQREDEIENLKQQREAIEQDYQDQIDLLQNFLDIRNYEIEKANRTAIESFDDLTRAMQENGIYTQEFLQKAVDWVNEYNDAANKVNADRASLTSNVQSDGIIYNSSLQSKINEALSGFSIDTSTGAITSLGYDSTNASGQTIYIDNLSLPDVSNVNEFIEALKDLPRKAASKATSRK